MIEAYDLTSINDGQNEQGRSAVTQDVVFASPSEDVAVKKVVESEKDLVAKPSNRSMCLAMFLVWLFSASLVGGFLVRRLRKETKLQQPIVLERGTDTSPTAGPTTFVAPIAPIAPTAPTAPTAPNALTSSSECDSLFPPPPPLPGKKGAAFTLRSEGQQGSWIENLPKVIALEPYWNYNWAMKTVDAQPDNIEFVPMTWGAWDIPSLRNSLQTNLAPQIESGSVKRLFGFNEPDMRVQSNMPADKALAYWPELEAMGIPLATPSCAHADKSWMEEFMKNATATCKRTDWVGVHWYGSPNFESFQSYLTSLYEKFDTPLIITEMAPADWTARSVSDNQHSQSDVLAFMKKALPWMEQQEWIAGYAWFSFQKASNPGSTSALFDEFGELTACGRYYASVRTENPLGDQTIVV